MDGRPLVPGQPADGIAVALVALEGPPCVAHELSNASHVTLVTACVDKRVVQLVGLVADGGEPLLGRHFGVGRSVGHPGLAVGGS